MGQAALDEGSATYAEWQRCLSHAWFGRDGVPVVLFADDDELAKIAPAGARQAAAESLAQAVLERAPASAGQSMFSGFASDLTGWRRTGTGPPPTLPILALVGSRGGTDAPG